MMAIHGYKKYMKKDKKTNNSLAKIFALAFFGTLLLATFIIKTFSPTADTSIGDYKEPIGDITEETKKIVDNRLEMIQEEDQGRSFSEIMETALKNRNNNIENTNPDIEIDTNKDTFSNENISAATEENVKSQTQEPIYRVYIGSYTSADLAKVAKDIIQESGSGLNPIVKCIGSNNYTLQVGIFKNKSSADAMLTTIQQNHLPGRIVQEY